ncbi:MAG: hypothetical protein AAF934_00075 [Bacteroidota bacterium]
MKRQGIIKIFKKEYPYKFNMRAMRLFMEQHGLDTFEGYNKKLMELGVKEGSDLSFKGYYVLADLVITAIQAANPNVELGFDADEFIDEIRESPEKAESILTEFISSQPLQKPDETLGK